MLGESKELSAAHQENQQHTSTKMNQKRGDKYTIKTQHSKEGCENRAPLSDVSSTLANIKMTEAEVDKRKARPISIIVEGNIGCGKSTLLNHFGEKDNIEVFPEPVDKWRNNRGDNMLELFYQEPSRWSCPFESLHQFTLLQLHQAQPNCQIKMMERSIYSGKYCFIESLYESEKLQTPEYNVLTEWFDWLIQKDIQVDHIVYLRSTPEQCEKRILKRSRKEESGIPLEYLRDLHERHEDWLIRKKFELPAPVLVLDATKSLDEMLEQFKYLEDELGFNKL